MNDQRKKRKGVGLFVLGMALITLGITLNMSFMAAGVVFMLIGAAQMKKARENGE